MTDLPGLAYVGFFLVVCFLLCGVYALAQVVAVLVIEAVDRWRRR